MPSKFTYKFFEKLLNRINYASNGNGFYYRRTLLLDILFRSLCYLVKLYF